MIDLLNGRIVTNLTDLEFATFVFIKWAGYDDTAVNFLLGDFDQMTESDLRHDGLIVQEYRPLGNADMITLIKVAHGQWTILDADPEEVTNFVERMNEEEED